jgi:hypothetical protein
VAFPAAGEQVENEAGLPTFTLALSYIYEVLKASVNNHHLD